MAQDAGTYDNPRRYAKNLLYCNTSGTLLGTVAANTTGAEIISIPANTYGEITAVRIKVTNGGSAGTAGDAGPAFGICINAAGTGAGLAVGTAVYGTRADNTYLNLTLGTGTVKFVPADTIYLMYGQGTAVDTSQVFTVQAIEWKETLL